MAVFDYDGKQKEYEETLELAEENKIELWNTNYCFDLWLILHKEDYFHPVSHQDDYANDLRRVFGLSADANIKKEANVNRIVSQINLSDIITAIKRADKKWGCEKGLIFTIRNLNRFFHFLHFPVKSESVSSFV